MTTLFYFLAFGCLGITTEIFFTAFYDAIADYQKGKPFNYHLKGYSFIWMFPIYGAAAFFVPPGYALVADLPWLMRLLIYALAIFAIEFIAGWLLEKIVGRCPWHYETKWAVWGYIRLDYLPFWMIFGGILEFVYLILAKGYA